MLTPLGSPLAENVGVGLPVALTWKLRKWLTTALVELMLVKTGFVVTPKVRAFDDVEPAMLTSPAKVAETL